MSNGLKSFIAFVSFISGIAVGIIAMFIPPLAIIDSSVLWFIAQLLVFSSSIIGISFEISSIKDLFKKDKD